MIRPRTGPEGRRGGARAGFTLTEIVVVLVLMGIAAATVAPALGALLRAGDGAAARELGEIYRRARGMAASRGSAVFVTVDPATGRWRTFVGATGSPEAAVASGDLLADRPDTRLLAPGDGPTVVGFAPDGTARAPVVRVRADGRTRDVAVDPWTGRIRIRR